MPLTKAALAACASWSPTTPPAREATASVRHDRDAAIHEVRKAAKRVRYAAEAVVTRPWL